MARRFVNTQLAVEITSNRVLAQAVAWIWKGHAPICFLLYTAGECILAGKLCRVASGVCLCAAAIRQCTYCAPSRFWDVMQTVCDPLRCL